MVRLLRNFMVVACVFSALAAHEHEQTIYATELAADKDETTSIWRDVSLFRKINPEKQKALSALITDLEAKMYIKPVRPSVIEDNTLNQIICYCLGPCMTSNALAFEIAGFFRQIAIGEDVINLCTHEELKAVIAHELAHIKSSHSSKRLLLLLAVLGLKKWCIDKYIENNTGYKYNFLCYNIVIPLCLAFLSRMQEAEADRIAAQYLDNPLALSDALKKIIISSASKERLSSAHPSLKAREDAMVAIIQKRKNVLKKATA